MDRGAAEQLGSYAGHLRAVMSWDKCFPEFGHDTHDAHGIEHRDGVEYVQSLTTGAARS